MFEYGTPGDITEVSPSYGQFKTEVTVSGSNLRGYGQAVDEVWLAGVRATIETETDTEIQIVVTASEAKVGDVKLVANSGAIVTEPQGWTYRTKGEVTKIEPTSGQISTEVTISGTSLLGHGKKVTEVKLAGYVAKIEFQSDTKLIVIAAPGSSQQSEGPVVLTVDTGAIVTTDSIEFTYLQPSVIGTVTPNKGRAGSRVTIFGSSMCGGGTKIVEVKLATVVAKLIDVTECGRIVVEATDYGISTTGDVLLVSDSGAQTLSENGWTYIAEGKIEDVQPKAGQSGVDVTITGSSLFGGGGGVKSVTLAGVKAFLLSDTDSEVVVRAFDGPTDGDTGDILITGDSGVLLRLIGG
jgi:hypothetical protein